MTFHLTNRNGVDSMSNQNKEQNQQRQRNQKNRQQGTQNPNNTEFSRDFNEVPEDFQNPKQQLRRNTTK